MLTLKIWLTILFLFILVEPFVGAGFLNSDYGNKSIGIVMMLFILSCPFAIFLFMVLLFIKYFLKSWFASAQFVSALFAALVPLSVAGIIIPEDKIGLYYSGLISVILSLLLFIKEVSNPYIFSKSISPME